MTLTRGGKLGAIDAALPLAAGQGRRHPERDARARQAALVETPVPHASPPSIQAAPLGYGGDNPAAQAKFVPAATFNSCRAIRFGGGRAGRPQGVRVRLPRATSTKVSPAVYLLLALPVLP